MNVTVNVIGPKVTLGRKVTLELSSSTVRELVGVLLEQGEGPWKNIIREDRSLVDGCVVLVNGRNIMSLEGFETELHQGDEVTFTVLVAGG